MQLDMNNILRLWGPDEDPQNRISRFARDVGVSTKTVYAWISAGKPPESRMDALHYRIIPRQKEKLKKEDAIEAALDKEFGRGLFDDE
jgi:transposase-like protein